jgi:hypothetical protein
LMEGRAFHLSAVVDPQVAAAVPTQLPQFL